MITPKFMSKYKGNTLKLSFYAEITLIKYLMFDYIYTLTLL